MQGFKFDIRPYETALPGAAPTEYPVDAALATILTSPKLDLNAAMLLKNHALALRLIAEPGPFVLLDSEEYGRLCAARDAMTGWSFDDAPLLERIAGAAPVEVAEITKEDGK